MKGIEHHPERTLNEARGKAIASPGLYWVSVKQVVTVLLVAAILACVEREISGPTDGALLSAFTAYPGGYLHRLVSILLHRSP